MTSKHIATPCYFLTTLAFVSIPHASLLARILVVDTTASAEFTSIQEAIFEARNGDAVLVQPGRYREQINFRGKQISVSSIDPLDPGIVAQTIIDGASQGRAVTFNLREDSDSILTGFTITGATEAAIWCENASPLVSHCVIRDNRVSRSAITATQSGLTLVGNLIIDNEGFVGAVDASNSGLGITIEKNTIRGNRGVKGILLLAGETFELRDNTLESNVDMRTGGVEISRGGRATIINNVIANNVGQHGGGIIRASNLVFEGNIVQGNVGGGIRWRGDRASVIDSVFTSNRAVSAPAFVVDVIAGGSVSIDRTVIERNIHLGSFGQTSGAMAVITQTEDTMVSVTNSLIYHNDAPGITVEGKAQVAITHCTVVENFTPHAGPAGILGSDTGQVSVLNSILWANGIDVGRATLSYSCFETGGGDLSVQVPIQCGDPGFRNQQAGDFRLLPNSQLIDAGDPSFVPSLEDRDLDKGARLIGSAVDVGAYEFSRPGDLDLDGDVDLADYLELQRALAGLSVGNTNLGFDLDGDGDVDLADLVEFQSAFTGSR